MNGRSVFKVQWHVLARVGKCEPPRRSPCLEKHIGWCSTEFQCSTFWGKLLNILTKNHFRALENISFWLQFPILKTDSSDKYLKPIWLKTHFKCRSRSLLCRLLVFYMWKWHVHKARAGILVQAWHIVDHSMFTCLPVFARCHSLIHPTSALAKQLLGFLLAKGLLPQICKPVAILSFLLPPSPVVRWAGWLNWALSAKFKMVTEE